MKYLNDILNELSYLNIKILVYDKYDIKFSDEKITNHLNSTLTIDYLIEIHILGTDIIITTCEHTYTCFNFVYCMSKQISNG